MLKDEEEKNAAIIKAEGEAEAAKMINEAVRSFGIAAIDLRRLEASVNIASTLSTNNHISFIPTGTTGNLLNLRVWIW